MRSKGALLLLLFALPMTADDPAAAFAAEGAALLQRSAVDFRRGDLAAARTSSEAAAEKFAAANDYFAAWMALLNAAMLDTIEGNPERAVRQHEAALAMLEAAEASADELFRSLVLPLAEMESRDLLGRVLVALGQYDRAERELTRASAILARFPEAQSATLFEHWGDLRRHQLRYDEARDHYLKALEIGTRFGTVTESWQLHILWHLAEIESFRGRLAEALAWNDRALAFARERGQTVREVSLLRDRADLFIEANRFAEAREVLERARTLAEQTGDRAGQALVQTSIGGLEMLRGRLGVAAVEVGKAIDLHQLTGSRSGELSAWMMLANVYLGMRAFDSMDEMIETIRDRAAQSCCPSAVRVAEYAVAVLRHASGHGTDEDVVRAYDVLLEIPELRSSPQTRAIAGVCQAALHSGFDAVSVDTVLRDSSSDSVPMAGEIADAVRALDQFRRGDFAAARETFRTILALSPDREMQRASLHGIAGTYWHEGNIGEAARWSKAAADRIDEDIEAIADDELLARYLGERQDSYGLTVDLLARSNDPDGAFAYAERARSRAFLKIIGSRRIEPRRGSADPLLRESESLRLQIAKRRREAPEGDPQLEAMRSRYRTLLRRLGTAHPEYAAVARIEPLGLGAVREQLADDTTMVSYFLVGTDVHAWIVDRETCEHLQLPVRVDTWERVLCWSDRLRAGGRGARVATQACGDPATAEEAFDALFAPLRERIRHRRLLIIPHGVLHHLPFAALRDPKSGRYLIEDYTLLFAPSASALPFLREKETPVTGSALVLGDPDGSLGPLQGAQREAVAVARHFDTLPMLGAEAQESLLDQLDGAVDLLHIGAHGEYNSTNPLFSRIALAPGHGHDGELEVHEILNRIDLRGVNLVVLSACQTGVGERSGGDDIVGLTRAVLYAGSPGVISTLWDIDDDAAAVLMEELYCRLLDGAAVADALREAQLRLLRGEVYGDPRYWAAFLLTGDPQGRFNVRGAR